MNKQMLMTAIVVDNNDPEKLGRILITLPALPEGPQLWARVLTPYAGEKRGCGMIPEIDDEVLVAFTQGELSSAYVLGSLWGKQSPPPEELGGDTNNIKMIRTARGNTLILDDTEGGEKITLIDKEENSILISTEEKLIKIQSKGNVEIYADSNITIKAGRKFSLKADTIEIKADSSLSLEGGSSADLKGGTVNIN